MTVLGLERSCGGTNAVTLWTRPLFAAGAMSFIDVSRFLTGSVALTIGEFIEDIVIEWESFGVASSSLKEGRGCDLDAFSSSSES